MVHTLSLIIEMGAVIYHRSFKLHSHIKHFSLHPQEHRCHTGDVTQGCVWSTGNLPRVHEKSPIELLARSEKAGPTNEQTHKQRVEQTMCSGTQGLRFFKARPWHPGIEEMICRPSVSRKSFLYITATSLYTKNLPERALQIVRFFYPGKNLYSLCMSWDNACPLH